jgi:hypothetical protein
MCRAPGRIKQCPAQGCRPDTCCQETHDHRRWRGHLQRSRRSAGGTWFIAPGSRWRKHFAGKGSLAYNDPHNLGACGATGTEGANAFSQAADLVIGIGTRYSDFTTASKTAFQNKEVRFVNINVAEFDGHKHSGLALTGDARVVLGGVVDGVE